MNTAQSTNLILLYGDNQKALSKVLAKYKNLQEVNLSEFQNPSQEHNQILLEIFTPPFLAEKRVIIIYNLYKSLEDKTEKHFFKKLQEIPDSSIVVMVETSKIPKNAKIIGQVKKTPNSTLQEFNIAPQDLLKDSLNLLKKLNIQIDQSLLKDLIFSLDNNPEKLENELIKLSLFADNNVITQQDIQEIVVSTTAASVFNMMDQISAKNSKKALQILHNLLSVGEEPTKIFYLLARQIRIFIQLFDLKNIQHKNFKDIASITGLHPFVVRKTLPTINNFSLPQLQTALENILLLDKNLKTGIVRHTKHNSTDYILHLEKIIIDLCS